MQIDTSDMLPRGDINHMLLNCRTLSVKVGTKTLHGKADLSLDDEGNATLTFKGKK